MSRTRAPAPASALPEAKPAAATPAAAASPAPGAQLQKLVGRWMRPDGGYVLAITAIDANGRMSAGYFNPNPINVARAEALPDGDSARVFVELRDVNYPGSTYTLRFDPTTDQLRGVYYQATQQESFEVLFVRLVK